MADHIIIINGVPVKLIPLGYCACGCGGKTTVPTKNQKFHNRVKGRPLKFIHGHNGKGAMNGHWKGGKHHLKDSMYTLTQKREHPKSNKYGYMFEHILIAENALGKNLPEKAIVHHHTPDQLVICENQAYHNLIHQRKRAYEACGHADWRKCKYCKQYDPPDNLLIFRSDKYQTVTIYHAYCRTQHNKKLSMKLKSTSTVSSD